MGPVILSHSRSVRAAALPMGPVILSHSHSVRAAALPLGPVILSLSRSVRAAALPLCAFALPGILPLMLGMPVEALSKSVKGCRGAGLCEVNPVQDKASHNLGDSSCRRDRVSSEQMYRGIRSSSHLVRLSR
jgi:hypothetical protein